MNWTFRPATASDWPDIAALLRAADLPLAGAESHIDGFLLAFRDGALVGTAALEHYGEVALLRSVAVTAAERGLGLGQELVRRILDRARADGVTSVVLLTTTASGFFPRFGFRKTSRAEVPAAVKVSAEFRDACPVSSTVMMLHL